MQFKEVGVNRRIGKARVDGDFDGFAFVARVEHNQRMIVQPEVLLHAFEARGIHAGIVTRRAGILCEPTHTAQSGRTRDAMNRAEATNKESS
jgi:hypothetical protein